MSQWWIDPAIILEREDNRRSCPACIFNDFVRESNGWKQWFCKLGHDQNGGCQTVMTCRDWKRKGIGY